MARKKLFLHIGHGKTGTTAVQSALAIASADLNSHGIYYPIDKNEQQKAANFAITSGNWKHNPEQKLSEQCLELVQSLPPSKSLALSSESLFWHIQDMIECKKEWEDHLEIHVILAVRELEEMLSSEYQQRVKRHGEKRPFEQFLRSRQFISSHHRKAAEVLQAITKHQISNTVINYSNHKRDISQLIFQIMGVESIYPRQQIDNLVINRSLSQKELQYLTMINSLYYDQFPWISARLSDALAQQLPNVESQKCRISSASRRKLYEKNNDYLQAINQHLEEANEQLPDFNTTNFSKESPNDPKRNQKIRTEEDLSTELISRTLLEALRSEPAKKKLSNETVDELIKISQSDTITPNTQVELLEVAKLNRPQGQRLSQLLERARIRNQQL